VFVDGDVSMEKYQDEASGKTLSAIRIVQSTSPSRFSGFFVDGVDRLGNVSILRNPQQKHEESAEEAASA